MIPRWRASPDHPWVRDPVHSGTETKGAGGWTTPSIVSRGSALLRGLEKSTEIDLPSIRTDHGPDVLEIVSTCIIEPSAAQKKREKKELSQATSTNPSSSDPRCTWPYPSSHRSASKDAPYGPFTPSSEPICCRGVALERPPRESRDPSQGDARMDVHDETCPKIVVMKLCCCTLAPSCTLGRWTWCCVRGSDQRGMGSV